LRQPRLRGSAVQSEKAFLAPVAPGLFTATANARGPAIGYATHRAPGGEPWTYLIWQCNEADCQTQPIAVSPEFTTELILYGTGFGVKTADDAAPPEPAGPREMQVIIGGVTVPILSIAPVEGLPGASQLQLRLDQKLQGTGKTDLRLTVDGQTANIVRICVE
jgi:uncharacterized protein (TIGR03437 family)